MGGKIVARLIQALAHDDWEAVKSAIADVEAANLWRLAASKIRSIEKPHAAVSAKFHIEWTVRGHRIRDLVGSDPVLFDALRVLLPGYQGAGLTLYRGESSARQKHRIYGTAWTSSKDVGCMFARGLNAAHAGGGVLLSTDAPAAAIIAGPSPHSVYLGEHEYTVDRRRLAKVVVLARFPQA